MLINEVRGSGAGGSDADGAGVDGAGVDGWGVDGWGVDGWGVGDSGRVVGEAGTDGVGSVVLVGFAAVSEPVSVALSPWAQPARTTISAAVIRAGATAMSPP